MFYDKEHAFDRFVKPGSCTQNFLVRKKLTLTELCLKERLPLTC